MWENCTCELLFTGCNEVVAKVMFLHVCVILFTGGFSGQTPRDQADTPRPARHPPGPDRPPWDQADTPWDQTDPLPGSRLQHTVYERPVHILLESILVCGLHSIRLITSLKK